MCYHIIFLQDDKLCAKTAYMDLERFSLVFSENIKKGENYNAATEYESSESFHLLYEQ